MIEIVMVGVFAALVIGGGLMAALVRQVLYAILGMGLSLLGLSGLFLYLGSPFVAAMQLLIYIGGITVAIVFAMMLSFAMSASHLEPNPRKVVFAVLCASAFFAAVAVMLHGTEFPTLATPAPASNWALGALGHLLLNSYNLVFEALSLVLLVSIIGAILIAKEEKSAP